MLDGYVSEKEQWEEIKKWWHSNGKFIAIAVLIGLAVGFGWRYWHKIEINRADNAAMIYQSILQADAQNKMATVQGGAKILMDQFAGSPYASLSAFLWAKEAVAKNDLPMALAKLQWVIQHSDQNRLKQMARIAVARILLSQNNSKAAMSTLAVVNDKQFEPLIAWVRGDIFAQEGQAKKAAAQYQIAKNGLTGFQPAQSYLNQLLAEPTK
ncbi:MAG: hypothetical protein COY58_09635 [Gammaproteobacteria bacterium CG_4_10_14_0_8_um_filter_38_16]|nr:MAG: hypothetical protein COY58_09635 [Gammaproteobacteria bacterium CG_4_10_14_0_8_um_filter_38_16]PJA03054.1 MAG: hypothetical protein COX72_07030 [Gammaproteobacteria bacterium CG_4_10_14_0_2_um_filter_38_22]PJB10216.1 MAG: hypothetical protein CO120_05885 [Gammaproteobacteria bacterium CG_4_9_14_3_um_filter_38_9]